MYMKIIEFVLTRFSTVPILYCNTTLVTAPYTQPTQPIRSVCPVSLSGQNNVSFSLVRLSRRLNSGFARNDSAYFREPCTQAINTRARIAIGHRIAGEDLVILLVCRHA